MTGAWKYVASTVVVGPSGQPVVTRGYMEIGGMRIYDDQMQVGPRGEHVISSGWTEFPSATESYGQQDRTADMATKQIEVPEGLHPATADLVARFATALAEKLHKAQEKYDYYDGWLDNTWMSECQSSLEHHMKKGDPRDVAAYCAFMWHHGWPTTPQVQKVREANTR